MNETARVRRQRLRDEAEFRKARHERRSVEEQLMILDTRPGEAKRERERLAKA